MTALYVPATLQRTATSALDATLKYIALVDILRINTPSFDIIILCALFSELADTMGYK